MSADGCSVIDLVSGKKEEFIDITKDVESLLRKNGFKDGVCHVFAPHTTAAVTINENADPDVTNDIILGLDRMVPAGASYSHGEGNSPAHIKSSLVGTSVTVFVKGGSLVLGTWQGVYFCEFDGPRRRKVFVKMTKD